MKVIYPNGTEIIYNDARQLYRYDDGWQLWTGKHEDGGKWICSIQPSSGVIIESKPYCLIKNKLTGMTNENAVRTVLDNITSLRNSDLKALRDELKNFNFKTGRWKK